MEKFNSVQILSMDYAKNSVQRQIKLSSYPQGVHRTPPS